MKVILNKNVENVGAVGQVVEVKMGFARNYLIPQGFARLATPGNVKTVERQKAKEIQKEKESRATAEQQAQKISALTLSLEVNAGEDDKLYGSVSNADVAEALAKQGVEVDRKDVLIKKPIRTIGIHQVEVRCYSKLKASLKVLVARRKQ